MSLSLLLIVAIALVAITLLIVLALALLAEGSAEAEPDPDTGILVTLAAVRSPSGRPFFPTSESVQDFFKTLDDSREERAPR